MPQIRTFNWQDDDSTFALNTRIMGILEKGLYRGFFATKFQNDMILRLGHENDGTGPITHKYIKTDLTDFPRVGCILTGQGVVIKETDQIELKIAPNTSVHPRIDTIVLEHQYTQITTGTPATYKAITGSPASNPVAPAPTDPNKQVVLGYLRVNPNIVTLFGNATYERVKTPFLAGDPTFYNQLINQILNLSLNSMTDVDLSGAVLGDVLYHNGTEWVNRNLQDLVQNLNLKMQRTIENKATVFSSFSATPFTTISSGIVGLNINGIVGNVMIFNYGSSVNANIDGLPASFQLGTVLRVVFTNGVLNLRTDQFVGNANWLPIKRLGVNGVSVSFTPKAGEVAQLVRLQDHWLWVDENYKADWGQTNQHAPDFIKNKPTSFGADNLGFDANTGQLQLKEGSVILDSEWVYGGIKATSGAVMTGNRVSSTSHAMINNFGWNNAFIYPPFGYTIYDLAGFIPSLAYVAYDGDVDDNDAIYCKYQIEYSNNRIVVIGQNTENRANSWINYFALWIKQ